MKLARIPLALISLIALAMSFTRISPTRVSSKPKAAQIGASSCVDRYNSLLKSAKAALIAGDRVGTVDFLNDAKRLFPVCPALGDMGSAQAPLLTMNPWYDCGA
jgi:hypothetical protein